MRDLRGGIITGGRCFAEGDGWRFGQSVIAGDGDGKRRGGAVGISGSGSAGSVDFSGSDAGTDHGKPGTATESGVHAAGVGDRQSTAGTRDGDGRRSVQGGDWVELRRASVSYRDRGAGEFCGDGLFLFGDGSRVRKRLTAATKTRSYFEGRFFRPSGTLLIKFICPTACAMG